MDLTSQVVNFKMIDEYLKVTIQEVFKIPKIEVELLFDDSMKVLSEVMIKGTKQGYQPIVSWL